ncbi:hypothetical protein V8E36_004332 [Tilletia maclaganii]
MATPGGSSAGSSTSAVFLQYNAVVTLLRLLVVPGLKNVIKDLQQGPFRLAHLNTTGKKAELQDRITKELDKARADNNINLFTHIYDSIKRNSGRPGWGQALDTSRVMGPGNTLGSATLGGGGASSSSSAAGMAGYGGASASSSPYASNYKNYAGLSGSSSGSYHGGAGVLYNKMAGAQTGWNGAYMGGAPPPSAAIGKPVTARGQFRPSPFYELRHIVSSVTTCPEAGPNERKNVTVHFILTNEHQQLLKEPRYQVRLFCSQFEAFNAAMAHPNRPAPVIFPLTCEARVNDRLLSANLKGNRKVPGKVPPPNLNKDNALHLDGRLNKVELSYVNTTYQKYSMICGLVETHSIDSLVAKVKSRPLTIEMVKASILKANEDEEIETGATKMTLRCPLSAMRIKVPSRSRKCNHRQCFDADTFFQLNEQTPSWTCPVCNNTLIPDDLVLDQYVETVLKQVPEDQDSIVVEPDASWHTEDNKFRSAGGSNGSAPEAGASASANGKGKEPQSRKTVPNVIFMDLSPSPPNSPRASAPSSSMPFSVSGSESASASGSGTGAGGSGPYSVPSSSANSNAASGSAPPRRADPIVIDLTLSSDEDDGAPPAPRIFTAGPPPSRMGGAGGGPGGPAGASSSAGSSALPRNGAFSSSSSSASPAPPGPNGTAANRDPSSREDSVVRGGDNAPQPPGRPLASSSLLQRRPREVDDEGNDIEEGEDDDDDEDDDNVVLSPDRRRVRRRIGVGPNEMDGHDAALQSAAESRDGRRRWGRLLQPPGLVMSRPAGHGHARVGGGDAEDEDEDGTDADDDIPLAAPRRLQRRKIPSSRDAFSSPRPGTTTAHGPSSAFPTRPPLPSSSDSARRQGGPAGGFGSGTAGASGADAGRGSAAMGIPSSSSNPTSARTSPTRDAAKQSGGAPNSSPRWWERETWRDRADQAARERAESRAAGERQGGVGGSALRGGDTMGAYGDRVHGRPSSLGSSSSGGSLGPPASYAEYLQSDAGVLSGGGNGGSGSRISSARSSGTSGASFATAPSGVGDGGGGGGAGRASGGSSAAGGPTQGRGIAIAGSSLSSSLGSSSSSLQHGPPPPSASVGRSSSSSSLSSRPGSTLPPVPRGVLPDKPSSAPTGPGSSGGLGR